MAAKKDKAKASPKPAAPSAPPAAGATRMLRITSSQEGFWRAGVKHSRTPKDHALNAFNTEQVAQLEAEPKLTLEYVDMPAAPAGD